MDPHPIDPAPVPREYTRGAPWRWGVLAGGILAAGVLFPFDAALFAAASALDARLGGDARGEIEALQQFGAISSVAIVFLCIWLLDPARRARLADLVMATGLTSLVVLGLKILIGRPRPPLHDPGVVLGPFGAYPFPDADPPGVYHAWDLGAPISADLWSMPSSHTSAAVALAVFLALLYPRLIGLVSALAVLVGLARVVLGAHYPSDVIAGGAVGFWIAHAAVSGWWGVRALDWFWVRAVNRRAAPAYPRLYASAQHPAGWGLNYPPHRRGG